MALHGHAKIELTNVKTGEVQTVEEDNMFTNALSDMFSEPFINYLCYNYSTCIFPIEQTILGGIVLMNEERLEDSNKYIYPFPEQITGYANQEVNSGTDILRGSRNLTESKAIENGYKFVYDFSTSQGNGLIKSIGLTSNSLGYSNGNFSQGRLKDCSGVIFNKRCSSESTYLVTDENIRRYLLCDVNFDFDNSILTCIKNISNTKIIIIKFLIPFPNSIVHIGKNTLSKDNNNMSMPILLSKKEIESPIEILDYNLHFWVENPNDNYYYCVSYDKNNKKIKIIRMSKVNYEIDLNYSIENSCSLYNNGSSSSFVFENRGNYVDYYSRGSHFFFDGDLCFFEYYNRDLYRISIETGEIAKILEFSSNKPDYSPFIQDDENPKIVYNRNSILYKDKEGEIHSYLRTNPFSSDYGDSSFKDMLYKKPHKRVFFGCYSYQAGYDSYDSLLFQETMDVRYLATINNLETPITKTPDQAMKITYTITEDPEEV